MEEKKKITKFLELRLKSLENKNNTDFSEITRAFQTSLEYLDLNNTNSIASLAKEELSKISYEDINEENINSLEKLNQHFQSIYAFMNAVIEKTPKKYIKPTHLTFAIPTVSEMFGIIPMFAGKPQKVSQSISKLLNKLDTERSIEEQIEVDNFVESVFQTQKAISYAEGKEVIKEEGVILICDNPIVKAHAQAEETHIINKEGLISHIKKTYGAEGLRHLLAILIGLEENGRKGVCKLSINEHLNRLGYSKGANRTHKIELKKTAAEIIYILSSLYVTIIKKKSKTKTTIEALKLFNLEGIKVDLDRNEMINSEFHISTTGWYNEAFLANKDEAPRYTKLLKSITHESHLEHSLSIYLTTIFSIFWRMKPEFEIKVSSLMEWCDIDINNHNRFYHLRNLEEELDYMKKKEYLGNWEVKDFNDLPSKNEQPFECVLKISPPDWLNETLLKIDEKQDEVYALAEEEALSLEDFERIFKESNITIKEFCEKIEISPRMFHLIKKGERKISNKISEKIIQIFS